MRDCLCKLKQMRCILLRSLWRGWMGWIGLAPEVFLCWFKTWAVHGWQVLRPILQERAIYGRWESLRADFLAGSYSGGGIIKISLYPVSSPYPLAPSVFISLGSERTCGHHRAGHKFAVIVKYVKIQFDDAKHVFISTPIRKVNGKVKLMVRH